MQTFKEPEQAFDNAIAKGLLSTDKNKENFAGYYMYMYSENNKDFFKDMTTRAYLSC